jgi:mannose-6-phosphate isomerase-like protein (cupin superfamily)
MARKTRTVADKCALDAAVKTAVSLVSLPPYGAASIIRSTTVSDAASRYLIGPGDGLSLFNPLGGQMIVKVRDEVTAGAYSIHDNVILAGAKGPRPHLHRRHDELFYVVEGVLTVRVGSETVTAPAGSFVVIPKSVLHQPSNPSPDPVRVLLIFSPGGMDTFFAEAAERRLPLVAVPMTSEVETALAEFTGRYGYGFGDFPPEG